MGNLTDEQRAAVETLDRAVTLVAAAGSGKTTVLVRRYLELLRHGHKPSQILTVTFTKEAAEQLRERILEALLLDTGARADSEVVKAVETASTIGTLHSFCYSILGQYGSCLGFAPIERILDPFERADTFDKAYRAWLEELPADELRTWLKYWGHGELRDLASNLYSARHTLRRCLSLPEAFLTEGVEKELFALVNSLDNSLFGRLEKDLCQCGTYSFDDLEHLSLRILREVPEARSRLQEQLQFFLVDEFQDTSRLQWDILESLLGGAYQKLFVVGDPKQSIYSFRHAEVRLFHEVSRQLVEAKGELLELTTNFRSQPELVEQINSVSRLIFAQSEMGFSDMTSGASTEGKQPGRLQMRRYEEDHEIREVVGAVQRLLAEGSRPQDIALLFRVSDRIADYARALEDVAVPVSCRRTGKLFSTYDAMDILTFLKALNNPLDDFVLAGLLRSPYVGLSVQELWEVSQRPGTSLFEKLMAIPDRRVSWFLGLVESGCFEVKQALEWCFGSSTYWPRQSQSLLELLTPLADRSMTVAEAVEKIQAWEKEDILLKSDTGESSFDAISLMTTHAAKGLEFPHVLLVDCLRRQPRHFAVVRLQPDSPPGFRYRADGEWVSTPTYESIQQLQEAATGEESKRVLYVALTRAKQSLTVFLPQDRSLIPKNTWGALLEEALGT